MEETGRHQETGSPASKIEEIERALETKEGREQLAREMAPAIRKHLELCAVLGVKPEEVREICEAFGVHPSLANFLRICREAQ